ncbi:MAG: hypothetical protein HC769_21855 [Cyanobacteria bacterium CRU_2_1]|nr:hypothetical protein [Cyanobacteria bacterium RU_5_0]NJR61241.1 hypothetical protein [Cyanobacteria bacterium CRU_2_1]
MNILILGNASDVHAAHLQQALEQAGAIVNYWDIQQFPTQLRMSWQPDSQIGQLAFPDGKLFKFEEIHSVFWRCLSQVNVPLLIDPDQHSIAIRDAMSTVRSIIQACPVHWVNSWGAYQFHKEKPLQLNKAKQIGVKIPATLISNDPEQVTQFVQRYDKTIFKPVYGGAHTQFVTSSHLDPQRLNLTLRLSPVTIQEYIPGTNVRSYVIADSVYAAEIRSHAIDFREDADAQLIPIELPDAIRQQCLAIANAFSLEWTAIDWRMTPTGAYVFLEANPSPMFLHVERQTGFPITQHLVTLLMRSF